MKQAAAGFRHVPCRCGHRQLGPFFHKLANSRGGRFLWEGVCPGSVSRNSTRCTRGNSRARQLPNASVSPCVCPGCGARIMRRALNGACILRPLPLLRLAASAAGGARLRSPSTKFYGKSRTRHFVPRTQFAVKFPCRCRRRRRMSADGDGFRLFRQSVCKAVFIRLAALYQIILSGALRCAGKAGSKSYSPERFSAGGVCRGRNSEKTHPCPSALRSRR